MKHIQSSLTTVLLSGTIILAQKAFFESKTSQILDNHYSFQETLDEASSHYLNFMLIALFLKIAMAQMKRKSFADLDSEEQEKSIGLKRRASSLIRVIFADSMTFWFLHIFWFVACSLCCEVVTPVSILNTRMLEAGEDKEIKTPDSNEILSLSIGNVVGSLDFVTHAITLSHDSKTAFIVVGSIPLISVRIYNVADFQDPVLISSLQIEGLYTSRTFTNLFLSDNGKTLYTINLNWFEIVDVSDYKKPVLIESYKYDSRSFDPFESGFSIPATLYDDGQLLFIGREDLHIFYVADKTHPLKIEFTLKESTEDEYLVSSLAVGTNEKVLYLTYRGALRTYNLSDIDDITLIQSYSASDISFEWISLSKDNKTTFVLGSKEGKNVILQRMERSWLREIETFDLNLTSVSPMILAISPNENQIFIGTYDLDIISDPIRKVVAFNLQQKRLWRSEQSLLPTTKGFVFQSSRRIFEIQPPESELRMIEFDFPFPNSRMSSLSNNLISTLPFKPNTMSLSSDGKYLFVKPSASQIDIWNMSDISSPTQLKSFDLHPNDFPLFIEASADNTKLFIITVKNNSVYDISNLSSPLTPEIGFYENENPKYRPAALATTQDANYQYTLARLGGLNRLTLTNLSNLSSIVYSAASVNLRGRYTSEGVALFLTRDQNTLFVVSPVETGDVSIFNVSNRSTFELIGSFRTSRKDFSFSALSYDERTFFLETKDSQNRHHLEIYNISNLSAPVLISGFPLPVPTFLRPKRLMVSRDLKTIYQLEEEGVFLIDVSDLKAPRLSGLISMPMTIDSVSLYSPSQEVVYITKAGKPNIVDLRIKYALFFKREIFLLGERYEESLRLLNFDKSIMMYDLMPRNSYKFIKAFLMNINTNRTEYLVSTTSLPYWMTLDKENSVFTIEPQNEKAIGNHTLCSGFSTKVSPDIFVKSGLFKDVKDSQALMMILVIFGHLDNRYFLTSSLTTVDDFLLPEQYTENKARIFEILQESYFETCTQFELISSLNVSCSKNEISIKTPHTGSIKLDIKLGDNQTHAPARFLLQSYKDFQSKIIEENSRLILEGTLKEIEAALKKLVIDLENDEPCDGRIIVSDNLNPQMLKDIRGISDYFEHNEAPKENVTVKSQIEAKKFYTGQSFIVLFEDLTFYDKYSPHLTYELHFLKKGVREKLPSWVSFNNLFLNGIPPEELFDRDFDFEVVAKNEFRSKSVQFTMHVSISPIFALKLAAKYCPYILTIIGLVVYANRIYNVVFKRRYKHKKEYHLQANQKITNNILYPIFFVKEENRESEFILKALRILIADELGKKSVGSDELASYFVKQEGLDRVKFLLKVQEAVNSIKQQKLKIYPLENSIARQVLNQILINKMTMMCLNLPCEKITKKMYEDIKDSWIDIVDWEDGKGFVINQKRLSQLLENKGIQPGTTHNSLTNDDEKSLQVDLIDKSCAPEDEVNQGLLQDAVLAYAFESHHLNYLAARVQVNMKRKIKKNFISRFLKRDLRNIYNSARDKRGYGLKCKIKNDVLYFSGVINEKFDDENILVIQLVNGKERILKEIWIYGSTKSITEKIEGKNNDTIL